MEARAEPIRALQRAARRDKIAALVKVYGALHRDSEVRDPPRFRAKMHAFVWEQYPDAGKIEIDKIWADRPADPS